MEFEQIQKSEININNTINCNLDFETTNNENLDNSKISLNNINTDDINISNKEILDNSINNASIINNKDNDLNNNISAIQPSNATEYNIIINASKNNEIHIARDTVNLVASKASSILENTKMKSSIIKYGIETAERFLQPLQPAASYTVLY